MPGNVPPRGIAPLAAPPPLSSPSARELRAQAVHRLQMGLIGLCAMLLIVALANIIMDRAKLSETAQEPVKTVVAVDSAPKKPATDPLADIGVVPAADPAAAGGAVQSTPTTAP